MRLCNHRKAVTTATLVTMTAALFAFIIYAGAATAAQQPSDAAALKNPVPVNAASLAAGKKLFSTNCAPCHGVTGVGDGKAGELLNPRPANLTDATWKHGGSEAEIFTTIRDGAKGTGMKGFGGRLTTQELWQLVNYVRSLGPKPP